MSAIAGILSLDHGHVEADPAERMAALLSWRGPDDEGSYRSPDGRAALAARRRAPVDEPAEAGLPLANETHDVWLVLDGEVLNHRALRHSLELVGHRFRSGSDAEVALHAYEQWDLGFVTHLQGAFALALWDDRRDRLVLARDRLGRKPLYLAQHRGRLGFASAVRPLLEELGLPRRLDAAGLAQYLAAGWVAPPRTLVAGIGKLGPGEMLLVEAGGKPMRRLWGSALPDDSRATATRSLGNDRQAGNLRTLLDCSIADRMMGDARVGVRLGNSAAGGLVAAVMCRLAGRPAPAVAVLPDSDGPLARTVRALAAAAGCDLAETVVDDAEAAAAVPLLAARLAEPVADPGALTAWLSARLAGERGITALMAEEGAAELLLAHPVYEPLRRSARLWQWTCPLPRALRRRVAGIERSLAATVAALAPIADSGWPGLLGPAATGRLPLPHRAIPAMPAWMTGDPLAAAAWTDLAGRGAESLALAADSASLAHGLHCRPPFLDEVLVAYALAMPGTVRALPAGRLLRRMIGALLPPGLAGLDGSGPGLPLDEWMAGRLGDRVERAAAESPLYRAGILAPEATRALLAEHRRIGGHARALWSLLVLAEWCAAVGLDGLAEGLPQDAVPAGSW